MIIKGIIHWAQILGEPRDNKFKPGNRTWQFDLSIDAKTKKELLKKGMKSSYVKNKGDDRGDFINFQRDEKKTNGELGKAFNVVDDKGQPWPQTKLIGNGSTVNVKVALNEREFRKEKFLKPGAMAVQVWDFVPYQSSAGFAVREDSETDTDMSDDIEDVGSEVNKTW